MGPGHLYWCASRGSKVPAEANTAVPQKRGKGTAARGSCAECRKSRCPNFNVLRGPLVALSWTVPVLGAYKKQQDEGGLSKGEAVQQVTVLVHGRLTNVER